jgi:hypothetical protein
MEWVDISDSARGDIAFFAVIDDFQTAFKLLDLTPKRLLQVPLKTRGGRDRFFNYVGVDDFLRFDAFPARC